MSLAKSLHFDMTTPRLILCKASAGSGKTFTLAKSYLKIILERPKEYDRILAVTFTNKATEEMKSRILRFLTEISNIKTEEDVRKSAIAVTLLKELDGWDYQRLALAAKESLSNILHDYSHFSIMTIDSFFQRLVRSFIHELKLSYATNVSLETDIALEYAIDALMGHYSKNADNPINKWIREISMNKIEDGKDWKPMDIILKLSKELFNEKLLENGADYPPEKVEALYKTLKRMQHSFRENVKQKAQEVKDTICHHRLEDKFSGNYLHNQTLKFLDSPEMNHYSDGVLSCIQGDKLPFAQKITKSKEFPEIEHAWLHHVQPACRELIQLFDDPFLQYRTASAILRHLQSLALLSEVGEKIKEYREKEQVMLISDNTHLIHKIVSNTDAPFLYEKLGNRYRYILLDEFQDTSTLQWQNMLPLLLEILAHRENCQILIVGDAKQSIYRWRNGNLQLILSKVRQDLQRFWLDQHSEMVLDSNFRSLKNVVEFNNNIFPSLAGQMDEYLLMKHINPDNPHMLFGMLHELFGKDDAQQKVRKSDGGYVSLRFFPKEDKKKSSDDAEESEEDMLSAEMQYLQVLLEDLMHNKGYAPKDICLLVREKKKGVELAEALESWGHTVMTAEALLFDRHPVIQLLTEALRFLSFPNEQIHLTALVYRYAQIHHLNPLECLHTATAHQRLQEWMPVLADEVQRDWLLSASLTELVLQLMSVLKIQEMRDAYTEQYLDLVRQFSTGLSNTSTADFLQWWALKERSVKVSDDQDAIQIMTIHKSKGLEFKVVIVPFANWNIVETGHTKQPILWPDAPPVDPFDTFDTYPITFNNAKESYFQQAYEEEAILQASDCLNIAYVAFTRATEQLYIMAKIAKEEKDILLEKANTIGKLLYITLQNQCREEDGQQLYEYGQPHEKIAENATSDETSPVNMLHTTTETASDIPNLKSPGYYGSEQLLGQAIHDIAAAFRPGKDIDQLTANISMKYALSEEDIEALINRMTSFFQHPDILKIYKTDMTILSERDLIWKGELLRFDLLLTDGTTGHLYDFKTGLEEKKHAEQLRKYRDALSEEGLHITLSALIYIDQDGMPKLVEVE
jgi:ATP-dependent helicase/nuclease subunit A